MVESITVLEEQTMQAYEVSKHAFVACLSRDVWRRLKKCMLSRTVVFVAHFLSTSERINVRKYKHRTPLLSLCCIYLLPYTMIRKRIFPVRPHVGLYIHSRF